ncbi:MAG: flagellar hook protein FlgE [Halomonas sp.]|nr:flagellar hook protein FlgE [Halomonas sp.]MDP3536526.1 flagellar hook protein FlgE [Halomonas sp.]
MSFSQALSGLNAQQQKLGAVGNNIANSQTVGFKSSSVQFADVFAESRIGLGTRTSAVLQNFSQGNIESTNRNMDLAIAGEGFFRFQQPNGEVGYSRNGQLTMTADGRMVNAQGAQIMGYAADDDGNVLAGGDVAPLNVPAGDLAANPTTRVSTALNLDSRKEEGEGTTTATLDDGAGGDVSVNYHFSSNYTVFDSLGNARNITSYYEKTGANAWTLTMAMDGQALGGATPTTYSLEFNSNGQLTGDGDNNAAGVIEDITFGANDFLNDEPDDIVFNLSFDGTTQFGNNSTVNDVTQNGFTSGSLVGVTIEDDGTIMRNYSNEQSLAAGQIALVSFRNPEGLRPDGDNLWSATGASGQELVGAPGTGLRGLIAPSAIETSNVDLARELVDMIVSQRAYQANSQTISTQDELLQTIINL